MKNSLAPSIVTTSDSKGRKFISIVEAAYNKARLLDGALDTPEGEAQRVNEAEGLSDLITKFIDKHRTLNTYESEEVGWKYGYLSGYKPSGVIEQTKSLLTLFPGLRYASRECFAQIDRGEVKLPKGAEGWFAIPNIWKKGGLPQIGATYSECVQKVLDLIKKTRDGAFQNYREGQIDERHLRQLAKTKKVMAASRTPRASASTTAR